MIFYKKLAVIFGVSVLVLVGFESYTPSAFAAEKTTLVKSENKKRAKYRNRLSRIKTADYGSFFITLSGDGLTFTELDGYEDFYGESSTRLNFGLEFYPLSSPYMAIGGGFKIGFYSDDGFARYQPISGGDYVKDDNGETSLSVRQYELTANILFTPFRSQFISFGAWTGLSVLDFSESRVSNSSSVTTNEEEGQKAYINRGSRNLITTGFSVLIDITPIEETPVYSMIDTIGVDRVYLSPYVTTSVDTGDEGADFSNQSLGIMFGFEAAK